MTCLNPKWIYLPKALPIRNAEFEENQKILRKPIWHFTKKHYAVQIPCGECENCLIDRAKDWAIKAQCEMKDHADGCFITLTYNNGFCTIKGHENEINVPFTKKGQAEYNKLREKYDHYKTMKILSLMQQHNLDIMDLKIKDIQDFWKRLRKQLDKENIKIRYIYCGERGDKKKRVHFHALIFGWKPKDLKKYKLNHQKQWWYESETIKKIWGHGFITVGELNFETASYTARYVHKKKGLKKEKRKTQREFYFRKSMEEVKKIADEYLSHYTDYKIGDAELGMQYYIQQFMKINSINKILTDKNKPKNEFIRASNRPGIGINYFLNNLEKIKEQKGILIHVGKKSRIMKIPKYFKNTWKKIDWESYNKFAYEIQKQTEKDIKIQINQLNYPEDMPEWQKEFEYINYQNRILKLKLDKLIRINIDE